jgi:hypothetical protein
VGGIGSQALAPETPANGDSKDFTKLAAGKTHDSFKHPEKVEKLLF